MTLRPYSVNPPRLALQVVADVLVLAWIYLWYRVGVAVHDAVPSAASVGYRIQNSAGGVADSLDQAGRNVGNTPLIGSSLSQPLRSAAEQIGGLAGSGRDLGDRLANAAGPAGWIVALAPILVVVAFWLPARWRFARRAGAAGEVAGGPAGGGGPRPPRRGRGGSSRSPPRARSSSPCARWSAGRCTSCSGSRRTRWSRSVPATRTPSARSPVSSSPTPAPRTGTSPAARPRHE